MPVVSVILPVYKVEKYLKRSVQTIFAQTLTDFEVILVDDGSPDKSGEICDSLAAADSRVSVIHQKNSGTGFARNAGLCRATGKYIYFMDPDDLIEENLLCDNINILEKSGADIVCFGISKDTVDSAGVLINRHDCTPVLKGVYDTDEFRKLFPDFFKENPFSVCNKIYRREFLEKNNYKFTSQPVGQDAIFNITVYGGKLKMAFNNKIYYRYIFRGTSAVNKYHPERFSYEFNISCKLEKLVKSWGNNDERLVKLSAKHYVNTVAVELNSICSDGCTMSNKDRLSHISDIMEKNEIKNAFKILKPSDFGRGSFAFRFILLKRGMYRTVLFHLKYKGRK